MACEAPTHKAEEQLQKRQYSLAKAKANEAFAQLTKVDIPTIALGKDFVNMRTLLDKIEEEISKDNHAPSFVK